MTARIFAFSILFLFLNSPLFANCPEGREAVEGIQISQGEFVQTQTCYLSIRPRDTYGMLTYRSFMFTSRGLMMTFSSFGDGPSSTHTGASELIFLPLKQNPSYEIKSDKLVVTMANGSQVSFDLYKALPIELSGGEFLVRPVYQDDARRSVYLLSYTGLVLDLGFRAGMSPSWFLNRTSVFKDRDGVECEIKNGEFFFKKNQETFYRHPTNKKINAFLKGRCPQLNLEDVFFI